MASVTCLLLFVKCLSSSGLNAQLRSEDLKGLTIRSIGPGIQHGSVVSIDFDMELPYNISVATQQDGFWRGPVDLWTQGEITSKHWDRLDLGSGAAVLVDRMNTRFSYLVYANGGLSLSDREIGSVKRIDPWAPEGIVLRHALHPPVLVDRRNFSSLYYGTQFVHKSTNGGLSWQIISGDLTRGERIDRPTNALPIADPKRDGPAITTLAVNPLDTEVIWAGSQDGNLYVTVSGGGQWENKRSRIRGLPRSSAVSHVYPSSTSAGSAFVIFENLEDSDARRAYIYKTEDYGNRWDHISEDEDILGPIHVLIQDVDVSELLFAGAEDGLYVTLNEGGVWMKWPETFPSISVRSIAMHPTRHDLLVGTEGRDVFVLDDLNPLRDLVSNPQIANLDFYLFEPDTAYVHVNPPFSGALFREHDRSVGTAKPYGASFYYWFDGADSISPVNIEVLDFENKTVRTLKDYPQRGINHFVWDLREDLPGQLKEIKDSDRSSLFRGIEVLPGSYKIQIKQGLNQVEQRIEVVGDPRFEVALVDRITKYQALKRYLGVEEKLFAIENWANSVNQRIAEILEQLGAISILPEREILLLETQVLENRLANIIGLSKIYEYRELVSKMSSSYDAPTEGQRLDLLRMEEALQALIEDLSIFSYRELESHSQRLKALGVEPLFFPNFVPMR